MERVTTTPATRHARHAPHHKSLPSTLPAVFSASSKSSWTSGANLPFPLPSPLAYSIANVMNMHPPAPPYLICWLWTQHQHACCRLPRQESVVDLQECQARVPPYTLESYDGNTTGLICLPNVIVPKSRSTQVHVIKPLLD
jgi:hypothetical protein